MRIYNQKRLTSHGNVEGRRMALDIIEAGLSAADPYRNAKKLVQIENGRLMIGCPDFEPEGSPRTGIDCFELGQDVERIFIFGAGKGIQRAVLALEEVLGDYLTGGHVIVKHGDGIILKKVAVTEGGHPVPDEACAEGCRQMKAEIESLHFTKRDLVFTIVGNGVSSLLTLPPAGVSLGDVGSITRILQIEKGLVTTKLNMVRNQIDQLKGGRITRLLYPARMIHLILTDANEKNSFGDSGYHGLTYSNSWLHTLPDISWTDMARTCLDECGAWERMPLPVQRYFEQDAYKNPGLTREEFEQMDCRIYGIMPGKKNYLDAAMEKAKEFGFSPVLLSRKTFTEARETGAFTAQIAKTIELEHSPFSPPCALFLTGELLVKVDGETGIGGRNQEFALAAAQVIRGSGGITVAAVDTDGTDGPGGRFHPEAWRMGCHTLAGGVTDGETWEEALRKGEDIPLALKRHDTSAALWNLDSGIWAAQNISVCDLIVVLVCCPAYN